jgi:cytochrome P450 family 6
LLKHCNINHNINTRRQKILIFCSIILSVLFFVIETLRKYPPATTLQRECNKSVRLHGTDVIVEKGTQVVIPVMALHHDPKYYPDPDRFDPERFSEVEKKKRPHFSYLPFGEGPRICIGTSFWFY